MKGLLDDHVIKDVKPTRNWFIILLWLIPPIFCFLLCAAIILEIEVITNELMFLVPYMEFDGTISIVLTLINSCCMYKANSHYSNHK